MSERTSPVVRRTFRAMGTDVLLVADDRIEAGAFERAARRVELLFATEERRFSRFRAESELSRVNARAGRWTRVTPRFAEVVRLALDAARETNGLFDPTVLPTLVALGYDRDFDEVLAGARSALRPAEPCGRWAEIELGRDRIRLAAGVGLDLGGIAKGWTADRAAEAVVADGLAWALVSAGGDLRLAGVAPDEGVEVGVEDAEAPGGEIGRMRLDHGALATSCITKRAWGPGAWGAQEASANARSVALQEEPGVWGAQEASANARAVALQEGPRVHHVIDPRTGSPADGSVLQATVWAPTCARAEVLAKLALLEGRPALERLGAVLLLSDGSVVTNLATNEPTGVAA